MSGHARSTRTRAAENLLSAGELRDLLNIAVQVCGRPESSPADLPTAVRLAAKRLGRPPLSPPALEQVARAVVVAARLPVVAGFGPLEAVAGALMAEGKNAPAALHLLIVDAWKYIEPEESAWLRWARPSDEDLLRRDLARATPASRFFLLAHDPFNGARVLSEPVCALGLTGMLLAELLLARLVRLDVERGVLVAREDIEPDEFTALAASSEGVSAVAAEIATSLRQPCPVLTAVDFIAVDAYPRVREELLGAGVLERREASRVLRGARTVFPPVRPRLVERVFNGLTALQTTDASQLDPRDAALIAIVRATGLAATASRQWWMAEKIPAEQALDCHRADVSHLIGHIRAATTTTVASRQR